MKIFWSLVYKTVPRENYEDTLLQEIMFKRMKEEGTEYKHACCVEGGDYPCTPESFLEYLHRQLPDSPGQHILVDKREISEEEYRMQYEDKERRAAQNAKLIHDQLNGG